MHAHTESALLPRYAFEELWSRLSRADCLYVGWFVALGSVIVTFRHNVPGWQSWLLVNSFLVLFMCLVAWLSDKGPGWRFAHDWYVLLIIIAAFEQVARLSLMIVPEWQDRYILEFENWAFGISPTVWLQQYISRPLTEILDLGYFTFYPLLPVVAAFLYRRGWREHLPEQNPFRQLFTATVLGYIICYTVFLLFPTESPARTLAAYHTQPIVGGPVHWLVLLIQRFGGVHGNAFPSGHIMSGFVSLVFAFKHSRLLGWIAALLVLLMSIGAVYDRYHYASDVVAGAVLGLAVAWAILWYDRRMHHSEAAA